MKVLLLLIFLSSICFYSEGQPSRTVTKRRPCSPPVIFHYSEGKGDFNSIEDIRPLAPSKEALDLIQSLLNVISLDINNETGIHLFSSDSVKSTASFIENNQPYIIYNPLFFRKFYSPNSENWQLKFAFAHELGHHLNGHTSISITSINRELASDRFAGWILGLLGATENETLKWMENVDEWTDGIHPPKLSRISSSKAGLVSAKQLMKTFIGTSENENFSNQNSFGPYELAINSLNSFNERQVIFDELDLNQNFRIEIKIRSTKRNGSTRFGLAWNYKSDSDFQLFTLHNLGLNKNISVYSIGRGNCSGCNEDAWIRYKAGEMNINGNNYNVLSISKINNTLNFYVNGSKVWETVEYRITEKKFAIWIADFSNIYCEYIRAYQ